jgi:hypothetical protein
VLLEAAAAAAALGHRRVAALAVASMCWLECVMCDTSMLAHCTAELAAVAASSRNMGNQACTKREQQQSAALVYRKGKQTAKCMRSCRTCQFCCAVAAWFAGLVAKEGCNSTCPAYSNSAVVCLQLSCKPLLPCSTALVSFVLNLLFSDTVHLITLFCCHLLLPQTRSSWVAAPTCPMRLTL